MKLFNCPWTLCGVLILSTMSVYGLEKQPVTKHRSHVVKKEIPTSAFNIPLIQKKAETLITTLHKNGEFDGVVFIAVNGKPIVYKSCGYADSEKKLKNKPTTRFSSGALAKQVTVVDVARWINAVAENTTVIDDGALRSLLTRTDTSAYTVVGHEDVSSTVKSLVNHYRFKGTATVQQDDKKIAIDETVTVVVLASKGAITKKAIEALF